MRRLAFVVASLLAAGALTWLATDGGGSAFVRALAANLVAVGWSSFVLPLRGLPRLEGYFELKPWERSERVYRAIGVPLFRAIVRRGPLAIFNRALPAAWHSHDVERIERETRAAEAGHLVAFGIVLLLALAALLHGEPERALWLAVLDIPLNLYPVALQRDHRVRLAALVRQGDFAGPGAATPAR